jgi:hypothetical protein
MQCLLTPLVPDARPGGTPFVDLFLPLHTRTAHLRLFIRLRVAT